MKCGMGILDAMRDSVRDGGGAAPAPPKHVSETQNKIADQIATFLRLGITVGCQGADRNPKSQVIGSRTIHFRFEGDGKESPIAKKLQRSRNFCFHNRRSTSMGQIPRSRIKMSPSHRCKREAL